MFPSPCETRKRRLSQRDTHGVHHTKAAETPKARARMGALISAPIAAVGSCLGSCLGAAACTACAPGKVSDAQRTACVDTGLMSAQLVVLAAAAAAIGD